MLTSNLITQEVLSDMHAHGPEPSVNVCFWSQLASRDPETCQPKERACLHL